MSDVLYTPDGHPFVPDDSVSQITVRPRVRDLVTEGDGGAAVNPLEFLYGSPAATGEPTQGGRGKLLRDLLQSAGRDASHFVTSLATAPYRLVQGAVERPLGEPLKEDTSDAYLGASMEGAGLAMGGGMPLAPRGALGTSGSRAMTPPPRASGPFYSAVEHAVREAPQARMTAEQWKGYLRNQPGVKAEELEFMGLGDKSLHPAEWKPGQPVTKQQMIEHAEGHGAMIKEIEKKASEYEGEFNYSDRDMDAAEQHATERLREDFVENYEGRPEDLEAAWEKHMDSDRFMDRHGDIAQDWLDENGTPQGDGNPSATKFHEYQLPGGDNYRELLLTLPEKRIPVSKELENKAAAVLEKAGEGQKHYGLSLANWGSGWNPRTVADKFLAEKRISKQDYDTFLDYVNKRSASEGTGEHAPFHSSHWGEPNVLVHLRMNDRFFGGDATKSVFQGRTEAGYASPEFKTKEKLQIWVKEQGFLPTDMAISETKVPVNGLRSLHLEEVQSDWHQQGRKKGYKGQYQEPDTSKWKITNKNGVWVAKEGNTIVGSVPEKFTAFPNGPNSGVIQHVKTVEEALEAVKSQVKHMKTGEGVPDAPFKSTWADLALKRAIAKAADEGYDAVSWTPGAQQAERYDLSKHVDKIEYDPKHGDLTAYDHDNRPSIVRGNIKPEQLPGIVGKDAADRLIKTAQVEGKHVLEGQDLKVGGEGMKAFYDKTLIDKANAIGKKFGAKVEWQELPSGLVTSQSKNVTIGEPQGHANVDHLAGIYVDGKFQANYHKDRIGKAKKQWEQVQVYDANGGVHQFDTLKQAQDFIKSKELKVPVLRLNDKLREAASRRGMPLFSAGVPFKFTPVDHDPFQEDK